MVRVLAVKQRVCMTLAGVADVRFRVSFASGHFRDSQHALPYLRPLACSMLNTIEIYCRLQVPRRLWRTLC